MLKRLSTIVMAILVLAGYWGYHQIEGIYENGTSQMKKVQAVESSTYKELALLEYDGKNQVVQINQNRPVFTKEELATNQTPRQTFSDLDALNRVGVANALLDKSLMPNVDREPLYVNPTGWRNKKITVNGKSDWLYNRSHLIGYQLTGENNNLKNLMTGTRSLNTPGMLEYENQVANYMKETGHEVRYRVTPVFRGDELVARGVQLEAQSIQDKKISFNVYIFNVQKGVLIHYEDGTSEMRNP
ncbi:DNA/RNA non-specific endonuclease [Listeria goaensis]|uniref:DNA/RNA non-specific endonuclease n=1 Tax=Listeria goaensis TaxID=1649188 RepID=UPI000B592EA0|nr:DNA/RNA non-specific endonuclease [Listeria goaensis]